MKTPREILLERHQAVVPKLNAIRRKLLNSELRANPPPHLWLSRWLVVPWRELVWPCRGIWAGLAAVWFVILAVNISLRDHSPTVATKSSEPSPEMILAFWRQEQSLIELIEPHRPRVAAPPKPALPRPRSQRRTEFLAA